MQTLQSLKKSIDSAGNLQSVVGTMKAHASSNITQFQNAARASMEYRKVLDKALYVILSQEEETLSIPQEDPKGATIHMVFGSDHGLAGRFNERIASYALENISKDKDTIVLIIGQQILQRLNGEYEIEESFIVPQTESSITSMVQKLLFKIDALRHQVPVEKVMLYYNKPMEHSNFKEEKETLFPIDLIELSKQPIEWESRSIPTYFMDKETLTSNLIQQYYFITLYRTFCYSLASENASRLASMQSAQKNIEERLEELNALYRRQRQNSITEEINDVISGFKAIKKSK